MIGDIATTDAITRAGLGMALNVALKGAICLAGAGLVTALMPRRSAAARHVIWTLACIGAIALPIMSGVLPSWTVNVPSLLAPSFSEQPAHDQTNTAGRAIAPASASAMASTTLAMLANDFPDLAGVAEISGVAHASAPVTAAEAAPPASTSSHRPTVLAVLLWVWLAGFVAVLLHMMTVMLRTHHLARAARIVTDPAWNGLLARMRAHLGLRRSVTVVRSDRVSTPAAWGIVHPIVIIPSDTECWTEEQRRLVLLHELAHVERWDCLAYTVAQITCAVHWFNPLAWWARYRLRVERERACDDRVLGHGERASAYAEQLVAVAYSHHGLRHQLNALPMARTSQLEDRVRRILDRSAGRNGVSRWAASLYAVAAVICLVPLAAFRPQTPTSVSNGPVASSQARAAALGAPVAAPVALASIQVDALVPADTLRTSGDDVLWSGVIPAGDTLAINNLVGEIRAEPTSGNRVEFVAHRYTEGYGDVNDVKIRMAHRNHLIAFCTNYRQGDGQTCDENGDLSMRNHRSEDRDRTSAKVDWTVRLPANVRLVARTVAGDITGHGLSGDVMAYSVGGDIDVSSAGHVGAITMGRVNVSMGRTDWTGTLRITAAQGITVRLPQNPNTDVRGTASFGRIVSDFALKGDDQREFGSTASGTVGAGGRTLELKTLSGRIALLNAGHKSVVDMDDDTQSGWTHMDRAMDGTMKRTMHRTMDSTMSRLGDDAGAWAGAAVSASVSETMRNLPRITDLVQSVMRGVFSSNIEDLYDNDHPR
jgi:beta-lactamase regulating signal transducer with metallopeptidase domain